MTGEKKSCQLLEFHEADRFNGQLQITC